MSAGLNVARVVLMLLVVGLLVPLGSAPAAAALPTRGILYDDTDVPSPIAERDWFSVDLNHDATTGRLWGAVELQGTPTAATASTFRIWLGNAEGSDCRAFALVGGSTVAGAGRSSSSSSSSSRAVASVDAARSSGSLAPARSSKARALVPVAFDFTTPDAAAPASCYWLDLAAGGAVDSVVYDDANGRFAQLESIDPTTLEVNAEGQRVTNGAWVNVPVAVENSGEIPATGVVVTLRKTSKVQATRSTTMIGTMAPGATATANIRVRLVGGSSRSVSFDVSADDGVETASGSFLLATTPKPPKASASLAGLYLWRTQILTGVTNWDNDGLFFVNKKFAFRGFPTAGLPNCRKVTATLTGDGCVRYWYDAKTRKLQVDTERGTSLGARGRPDGVKVGKDSFTLELVMPKKESVLAVDLEHIDAFMCPGPACTTSTTTVALDRDRTFALGAATGTYAIGRNGLLTLTMSDGSRTASTIWIQADRKGKPQPTREGLIMGDTNYYP